MYRGADETTQGLYRETLGLVNRMEAGRSTGTAIFEPLEPP